MMAKKSGSAKRKKVRVEPVGQAHIHSSFNNIIVTLTNADGDVISWSSSGKNKFRGSKKNTPYAAQMSAADCAKEAYELVLLKDVGFKGFLLGSGHNNEASGKGEVKASLGVSKDGGLGGSAVGVNTWCI